MASIRKRGENSYLIVVSRGYDYEGNRLKSAQKTVHPPMELKPKQREKWLQEQAVLFEREVHHTPEPVNKSITLAKYIDHWLAEVAPKKLAKTTYSRDQQDVRRILPALGHYKLTDLRKEVIRDFYEEMRKAPKLTDGKPLSEKSVEGIHNTLCSILSDAVEEGYLLHNPAWKMYKPQGEKRERPVADEDLVQQLVTALEEQSLKYETYFKLVLATGMRRGEACGVRWSDINWKKRSIHIQRNVVKLSREPNGDPMVPTTFTFRFKKILRQNGSPENLNVHSLRHTNASLLIAQGVDVRTVANLLGHSQASTTLDIYAHAFDKKKREAQEKLGEVMGL